MSDAPYRQQDHRCSACGASPMRAFGSRLICDACSAVQLDPADLADEIGLREVTFADGPPVEQVCPRCDKPLRACRITVGETTLDDVVARCGQHGLWLGPGALERIMDDAIHAARKAGHRDRSVPSIQGSANVAGSGGIPYVVQKWWEKPRPRVVVPFRSAFTGATVVCPGCRLALDLQGDHWTCEACGGVFVETAALEAMIAEMTHNPWQLPAPAGSPGSRECPVCTTRAVAVTLDGVEVDQCAAHGVWFDAGELARLLVRAAAGEDPKPADPSSGWLRRLFKGRSEP